MRTNSTASGAQLSQTGAIAYDSRILSLEAGKEQGLDLDDGRSAAHPLCRRRPSTRAYGPQKGESDLALVDGAFYLLATCEVETPEPIEYTEALGVDLGVVNIATDSDGEVFSGERSTVSQTTRQTEGETAKKGTKSAKRLLRKRRRKERRFAQDVNHSIAKRIVEKAEGTGRAIALEDLTGIRDRTTVRKSQRRQHHSWSFYDLRQKIEYKAELAGIPVILVDPKTRPDVSRMRLCG